jgi:hypothetical protein
MLCLAVAAALLAGCGGGSDEAVDDYRERADAICTTANTAADAVRAPTDDPASVADYAGAIAEIRRTEGNALRALTPPEQLRDDHDTLVRASDAVVQALESLRQAALQTNRAGAELASRQGQQAEQRGATAADALGLTTCRQ